MIFFFFPRICNLLQELGEKNNILTFYYRQGREMEINLSLFVKVQDKKIQENIVIILVSVESSPAIKKVQRRLFVRFCCSQAPWMSHHSQHLCESPYNCQEKWNI